MPVVKKTISKLTKEETQNHENMLKTTFLSLFSLNKRTKSLKTYIRVRTSIL